jgi:hypothetical protein
MPDTSVKYFHSGLTGAPVLSGTAGSLVAVLDACLVNGFAVSAVASLVVASNIATATISGGHSAEVGSVVLVSGATPSGLNSEKKVLSVGAGNTTLTFDAPGISDQTASGTISLKLAGAGWSKEFTGTNLAAYKSNNVAGTGCRLRVDDTAGKTARVVGYETMTASGSAPGSANDFAVLQNTGAELWMARSYTAVGASTRCYKAFPLLVPSTSVGFASGAGPAPYPNGPDSGLYLTPLHVFEANYHALRGTAPGLWCCPQTLPLGLFAAGARIAAADNLLDKDLRVVPFGAGTGTAAFAFFDTAGPWR